MTDTRQYNVDEGREFRNYVGCGINQILSETYHRKGPLSKRLAYDDWQIHLYDMVPGPKKEGGHDISQNVRCRNFSLYGGG